MRDKITNFVLNIIHKIKTHWEGSTIRASRLRKFKKKSRGISIAAQIVAIWYLFVFTGSYLTTHTGAYFNDIEVIDNFLGADAEFPGDSEEWDRSSLKFTGIAGYCTPDFEGQIYSELANVGDAMAGPTKFYLYKVGLNESGPNQKNPGELLYEGEVPPLPGQDSNSNKTMLIYTPDLNKLSPGKYKFKADQRPNHGNPNNDPNKEKDQDVWGTKEITITQEDIDNCKGITAIVPEAETPSKLEITNLKELHGFDSINLSWKNPEEKEFDFVKIYRNGTLIANNLTRNSFEDKNLKPASEYEYKLTVVNKSGDESDGVIISVKTEEKITEDKQPPEEVNSVSLSSNENNEEIEITWTNPKDQDFSHVKIYKDNVFLGENREGKLLDKPTEPSHVYKITTVDESGNESEGVTVSFSKTD